MRLLLTQPTLATSDAPDSVTTISDLLLEHGAPFPSEDVLVLPEHWYPGNDPEDYLRAVRKLARVAGCHVVGGSQHEHAAGHSVNTGVVIRPSGEVLTRYEKQRPYALERQRVGPGSEIGEFEVNGRRMAVFICADFWFSDLFDRLNHSPDVVLVPALSVTRKPSPDYSRALWRHLSTARAYEFGLYVGISDWSTESNLPPLRAAGVAGFSDPTGTDPEHFFSPVGAGGVSLIELDFDALDDFRHDRRERGFLWDPAKVRESSDR